MGRVLAPILVLLLLSACAHAPAGPPPIAEQLAQVQQRLYRLVAEERRELNADAKPLKIDPELVDAAQAHCEAMAKKHRFDTISENNVAIQHLLGDPKFQGYVVENSALQYFTPSLGIDPDAFARGFLDIWLKSPAHRANIAFAAFDRTGIGVAVSGNAIYAAEVFTTDLGLPPRP